MPQAIRLDKPHTCIAQCTDTQNDGVTVGKVAQRLHEHLRIMASRVHVEVTNQSLQSGLNIPGQQLENEPGRDQHQHALHSLDYSDCPKLVWCFCAKKEQRITS